MRIIQARGSLQLEALLKQHIKELLEPIRKNPAEGARPVRVLLASGALRRHLAARLVRELHPGLAGLSLQSLWSFARQLVAGAGHRPLAGATLFPLLVARETRQLRQLAQELEPFRGSAGLLAASVGDLLSAGFQSAHLEAAREALALLPNSRDQERALELLQVALATRKSMQRLGIARMNECLEQATKLVQQGQAPRSPNRALLIYGFSDLTGRGWDFVQALLRLPETAFFLDRPPDPFNTESQNPSWEFQEPLQERLGLANPTARVEPLPARRPPRLVSAPGMEGEARELAEQLRGLLLDHVPPESIAVVARSLKRYAAPLRKALRLFGIPFSGGVAPAALSPLARRANAAMELLEKGPRTPLDRCLEALGAVGRRRLCQGADQPSALEDLRLGLRSLGLGTLLDVANSDPKELLGDNPALPLPVRTGLVPGTRRRGLRAPRRKLPLSLLQQATQTLSALLNHLATLDQPRSLKDWQAEAFHYLEEVLGWADPLAPLAPPWRPLILEGFPEEADPGPLDPPEFRLLLGRCLASLGEEPLGGRGGGVQLLDAAQARGLTFDHLFILGANRNTFPRSIQEDPLLPDQMRRVLQRLLPDLHPKSRGHAEELHLFVQLLGAAKNVTLFYQRVDDEGRKLPPSPFVVRLQNSFHPRLEATQVPRLKTLLLSFEPSASHPRIRTAREHVQLAGLLGRRDRVAELLPLVCREACAATSGGLEPLDSKALADARFQVLSEWDPDPHSPEGRQRLREPGSYMGLLPPRPEGHSLWPTLFATTLESLARCPWQTLLTRILRLEAPLDSSLGIPTPDQLMLGNAVHLALQELAGGTTPEQPQRLREALKRGPFSVPRPTHGRIKQVVREAASRTAREGGVFLAGLVRILEEETLACVQDAVEKSWPENKDLQVLGAELEACFTFEGPPGQQIAVAFKADRVDQTQTGIKLVDYKTGRPVSSAKKIEKVRQHLYNKLGRGEALQAALYAARGGEGGRGIYLYLGPKADVPFPQQEFLGEDEHLRGTLESVLRRLVESYQAGIFFPRLELLPRGNANPACTYCDVSDACLLHDSGSHRRQRRRARALSQKWETTGSLSRREQLFLEQWAQAELPQPPRRERSP